jgi:hypothetical protein
MPAALRSVHELAMLLGLATIAAVVVAAVVILRNIEKPL